MMSLDRNLNELAVDTLIALTVILLVCLGTLTFTGDIFPDPDPIPYPAYCQETNTDLFMPCSASLAEKAI